MSRNKIWLIILITRPIATATMFLIILGASLALALIYRRRIFCQYLCPVGGFLGTYSMASMTELRAKTMIIPGGFALFVVNILIKLYMG